MRWEGERGEGEGEGEGAEGSSAAASQSVGLQNVVMSVLILFLVMFWCRMWCPSSAWVIVQSVSVEQRLCLSRARRCARGRA